MLVLKRELEASAVLLKAGENEGSISGQKSLAEKLVLLKHQSSITDVVLYSQIP